MSQRRPIDVVRSLRETRRSMGDGTVGGRTRLPTPRTGGAKLQANPRQAGVDQTDPARSPHRATLRTFQTVGGLEVEVGAWKDVVYAEEVVEAGSRGLDGSDPETGTWVADQRGSYLCRLVMDGQVFDGTMVRLLVNGDPVKGPGNEVGWMFSGSRIDVVETVLLEVGDAVRWQVHVEEGAV